MRSVSFSTDIFPNAALGSAMSSPPVSRYTQESVTVRVGQRPCSRVIRIAIRRPPRQRSAAAIRTRGPRYAVIASLGQVVPTLLPPRGGDALVVNASLARCAHT